MRIDLAERFSFILCIMTLSVNYAIFANFMNKVDKAALML